MLMRYFLLLSCLILSSSLLADQTEQTVVASRHNQPVIFYSQATIEAVHKATMTAETSGRIAEVLFDVEDMVNKGDVIARFRNQKQKAELDMALAGLDEAKAAYERSQAELKRYEELIKQQLVAKTALDKARLDFKTAEARLNAANASIKRAREEYDNTVIRAPYSGIVTQRHIEVGEAVNPGSPLFSGLSLDAIRAVADVPQRYVDQVRKTGQAMVYLAEGKTLHSNDVTVFPYADEKSHTFRVRVALTDAGEGLYPGMLVKIGFVTGERSVLLVPSRAIVNRGEITAVYVRQDDGRIAMRQVRAGETVADQQTVIHAGLTENESVYVDPLSATVLLKQQSDKSRNE